MKRLVILAALASASAGLRAGTIEVVLDGRYKGAVGDYRVGKTAYLDARDLGAVYGAQVYWYPVSGRLRLSLRGRPLELMVGSDAATLDGRRIPLGEVVVLRGSEAFVPASLLSSKEFVSWAGLRADLDGNTGVLSVEKVSSVGPMRWSSHERHTRLVVELEEGLAYKGSDRGLGGMDIVVPRGVAGGEKSERIEDGRVESVGLAQESGLARFSVKFAAAGLKWKLREIADPRRLVVDVYSGSEGPALEAPKGTRPPEVSTGTQVLASAPGVEPRSAAGEARRKFRVVIDAGHGGKDSGAVGRKGTREKDAALAVARALARRLEEDDGISVLMTRGEDYFVPLSERSEAANEFQADLFVSIHCNSSPKKADSGFEVYFLSENASDPEARRLAELENSVLELEGKSVEEEEAAIILRAMTRTEFINDAARFAAVLSKRLEKTVDVANRGVKQAAFYVLRGTDAPAVLVEIAYLSHRKEEAKLNSKSFRKKVVEGLYRGIVDYAKEKKGESQ
ncbi:MAG: N-acetylmuramoyl-L-alanine amidase [Elusimicrobia bacterium]|nr:N-acetylmuramoyl-L-alanine amidase [Elusimicrobiota bacterium]